MTILDELSAYARERVAEAKQHKSLEQVKAEALAIHEEQVAVNGAKEPLICADGKYPADFAFENALKGEDLAFICECKKASPSKGLIAPDFPYLEIAKAYEAAGASCISCLTEPKWFLGSDQYLKDITATVNIPVIRKDFTVDEYMIYEAKVLGASAVLLICSILSEEQIKEYIGLCDFLGLTALVEAHDEAEVNMALRVGARVIGVNNRNLKDFTVDTENSRKLRALIPENVIYVSESGVKTAEDVADITACGADAVLIGETLMRAPDKKAKLDELKGL